MTVDEVRKALEDIREGLHGSGCGLCSIDRALVTEGLKVLDDYAEVKVEYEKALKSNDDDGYREFILRGVKAGEQQINLLAAILRSAGRIA